MRTETRDNDSTFVVITDNGECELLQSSGTNEITIAFPQKDDEPFAPNSRTWGAKEFFDFSEALAMAVAAMKAKAALTKAFRQMMSDQLDSSDEDAS